MRNLTTTEMQVISGGIAINGKEVNLWRAGFDITGGGIACAVIGGAIGFGSYNAKGVDAFIALFIGAPIGAVIGGVVGMAGGAAVALGREIYNQIA